MMSADELGRRLLAEVEEGNLSEILAGLAALVLGHEHIVHTGVEPIDRLIRVFHAPNKYQRNSSPAEDSVPSPLAKAVNKKTRPVCLEITSPEADDGKTQLLYYLIAIAILPPSIAGVAIGGQQSAVIYLNCDGDFSIDRMVKVLETQILTTIKAIRATEHDALLPSDAELGSTIEHALRHLHIFSPQSIGSLIKTLESLPAYLYNGNRHPSMHRRVHSIVLDSATAFYWADRNDTDMANIPSTVEEAADRTRTKAKSGYARLRSVLSALSIELSCLTIYTTSNLFHRVPAGEIRNVPTSLPRAWLGFPTVKLVMRRGEVRGLPPAISAEEAARDARDRNVAVAQGLFSLVANEADADEWSADVRIEMRRMGNGRIAVRINDEGVVVRG